LIAEAAVDGTVRDDVPAAELASYCLHALTAAGTAPSTETIHRLITVTLAGLRPDSAQEPRPWVVSPQDAAHDTLRLDNGSVSRKTEDGTPRKDAKRAGRQRQGRDRTREQVPDSAVSPPQSPRESSDQAAGTPHGGGTSAHGRHHPSGTHGSHGPDHGGVDG
jgi:hypothetical protein